MSKTIRTMAAGLAAAAVTTAGAQAAVFLDQGLNTYQLSAFEFDGSAADAYSYGSPDKWSYNGDTVNGLPTAEDGVAKLFLVNTTEDGLTLFGVFDSVDDGEGGRQDSEWYNIERDSDMVRLRPDFLEEFAASVDHAEADALFISCGALRTIDVIDQLEQDLGKPVICSNQAMMWDVLRKAGVTDPISGYGRLLREF